MSENTLHNGSPGAPKFCRMCGTEWEPHWEDCPVCTKKKPTGGIIGLSAVFILYFGLLATNLFILLFDNAFEGMIIVQVVDSIAIAVFYLVYRSSLKGLFRLSGSRVFILMGILLSVLTFLTAHGAVESMVALLGIEEVLYTPEFFENGLGWGAIIASVCLQPAIFEEIVFRGMMYNGMTAYLADREIIILQGVLFAIIHLSVISFPHLLLVGLICGYLRMKTGSLVPGMVLHFCHNFLVILVEAL